MNAPADAAVRRRAPPADGARWSGMSPLLERLYRARGLTDPADCDLGLAHVLSPQGLLGIDQAARLLADTMRAGGRIVIVGDFDVDGASACALSLRVLRAVGADADYVVPRRLEHGYGLTPALVPAAMALRPAVLMTVDNGTSAVDGVAAANAAGVPVIVTDHHQPTGALPAAAAIVNPMQTGCGFASKSLSGVGVAFYVVAALCATLRESAWFAERGIAEPRLADYLDLVALGTIADMVRLDRNNRIMVHHGLRRLRSGRANPGMLALCRVSGRDPGELVAADISFAIAPRLNAAGRLADMSLAVDCLLEEDPTVAAEQAAALDAINAERRTRSARMRERADALLSATPVADGDAVTLCDPDWHVGMVGLLASQLSAERRAPSAVFATEPSDASGEMLRGSARSAPGLDLLAALQAIAASDPALLAGFGGHAAAAGLRLAHSRLDAFSAAFADETRRRLDGVETPPALWSDGVLPDDAFTLDTAQSLRDAGPWGQGFPEPVFDGEFWVRSQRLVGADRGHLRLRVATAERDGTEIDAIAFGAGAQWPEQGALRLWLAYRLDVNAFRGERRAQLLVESLRVLS